MRAGLTIMSSFKSRPHDSYNLHQQLPKNGGSGIVGIMGGRVLKADHINKIRNFKYIHEWYEDCVQQQIDDDDDEAVLSGHFTQ